MLSSFHPKLFKFSQPTHDVSRLYKWIIPPKFNSSPLQNNGWNTSVSHWEGNFSGAFPVKLQEVYHLIFTFLPMSSHPFVIGKTKTPGEGCKDERAKSVRAARQNPRGSNDPHQIGEFPKINIQSLPSREPTYPTLGSSENRRLKRSFLGSTLERRTI